MSVTPITVPFLFPTVMTGMETGTPISREGLTLRPIFRLESGLIPPQTRGILMQLTPFPSQVEEWCLITRDILPKA